MKVLVISNLYPPEIIGGYEIQCAQAVAELRRRGYDVLVLTSVPRRPVGPSTSHVLRSLSTPDVYSKERAGLRSPFWEFEANLLNVENVFLLLQVIRDWQPDVCYLWNLVSLGGVGIVAALEYLDVPWVWHLGDEVPSMLCNFNGRLPTLGQTMGSRFSGRFIACSQTVVNTVERLVPIQARTRIVPNWITGASPAVEREHFCGGVLRLAYAGRIVEEKGVFLLLDMVAQLRDGGYSSLTLDIIGSGEAEAVRSRVDELAISNVVNVRGWMSSDQLRDHLKRCDIFVFPTWGGEPFGLAPIEAASVGCVPLIPLLSGVSEWLVDGVHCLKAERSPTGFAEVIRAVMDGIVDLAALARRAVRAVHDSFAIDNVIPAVEHELALAAARRQLDAGRADDFYRVALLADALLRESVLQPQS